MTLTPGLRKLVLTAHVTFAVGWLGAVASFLALAIVGLSSKDVQLVRGVYLAIGVTAWFIILPLSLAPLITGPILSLGTKWGLFRHYWIVIKLLINVLATVLLLVHMQVISHISSAAVQASFSTGDLRDLRLQLIVYAVIALLALLAATILAVYKPRGMTPYGWRKQQAQPTASQSAE